jgi:hypothetical protein
MLMLFAKCCSSFQGITRSRLSGCYKTSQKGTLLVRLFVGSLSRLASRSSGQQLKGLYDAGIGMESVGYSSLTSTD